MGKISSFLCLSVNISKTVADDWLKLLLSVIIKPYSSNPTIPLSTHSVTHDRDSKHLPMARQVYIVDATISCYYLLLYAEAVLRGGQGGHGPPCEKSGPPCAPPP